MKECNKCGETKDINKFQTIHKNGKEYKYNTCTSCKHKAERDYNPEAYKAHKANYNITYKINNPNKVILSSTQCKDKRDFQSSNDLTIEFICKVIAIGCFYCGCKDGLMTLDRIDNDKPHYQDNVNASCYRCNMFRGTCPYNAWMNMVPLIKETYEKGLFGDWKKEHFKKAQKLSSSIEEHVKQSKCINCDVFFDGIRATCSRKCSLEAARAAQKPNFDWSKIDLEEEIKTKNMSQIGREIGCSSNSVKKRLKKLGLK